MHYNTYGEHIGIIDGQLKYAALWYSLTLMHDQPQKVTRTVWDLLEGIVDTLNSGAPSSMNKAYHTDGGVWTWML